METFAKLLVFFAGFLLVVRSQDSEPGNGDHSCCPEDSWSELLPDSDYQEQGVVETVDDIDVYRVGEGSKCIIWNYDIFGFNSGRTRQFADKLAELGYLVIIPDYYRGTFKDPRTGGTAEFLREYSNWDKIKKDWDEKIRPYAEQRGAEKFGAIGTCWGSYPVIRLSALPEVNVGVSMHPSHPGIMSLLKESEEEAYEAIKNTHQLFMPSGGDAESLKKGGLAQKVLGDNLTIVEFPEMFHGWTVRGDISNPKIEAEVERAMREATRFFNEHL